MWGRMGGEVSKVRRKYIVGPHRHCEDVGFYVEWEGKFLCGFGKRNKGIWLTCSIASPLLLNWKLTLRRQGLLWLFRWVMVTIWFRRSSQKVALGMCFQGRATVWWRIGCEGVRERDEWRMTPECFAWMIEIWSCNLLTCRIYMRSKILEGEQELRFWYVRFEMETGHPNDRTGSLKCSYIFSHIPLRFSRSMSW